MPSYESAPSHFLSHSGLTFRIRKIFSNIFNFQFSPPRWLHATSMTDLLWLQVLFHPALGFLRNIEMIIFDYDRFFLSLVWQFANEL